MYTLEKKPSPAFRLVCYKVASAGLWHNILPICNQFAMAM